MYTMVHTQLVSARRMIFLTTIKARCQYPLSSRYKINFVILYRARFVQGPRPRLCVLLLVQRYVSMRMGNNFLTNINFCTSPSHLGATGLKLGGCPKLKKREILLLYYYSYTIVYDFTARITIVIPNILKYSRDDFISVLR